MDPLRRDVVRGALATCAAALLPSKAAAARPAPGLEFATALQAAEAIRRRRISSLELTRLVLARIERYNPALNAIVNVTTEEALAAARAADEALARGRAASPLHGVPITIKDSFEVKGLRTTAGAESLRNHVPTEDAEAVARLRAAGTVIVGNTNVPVLLADWQSDNPIYGRTNNPWDLARTPGGSSGGSTAALAAGLGYLSIGSDIGGSIRIPAHFSGVYGHKPSLAVVSHTGHIPPLPSARPQPHSGLAAGGPLARGAADLEAAMRALGGPTTEDAVAWRWTMPPARRQRLRDYRIGYVLDDPRCPVASDVRAVLSAAMDALRRAGVNLVEGWPAGIDPAEQFGIYRYLLWSVGTPLAPSEPEAPGARAPANTAARVREMQAARLRARSAWAAFFRDHDAFLMPTAFVAAFPHDRRPPAERRLATPEGERPYSDLLFWISIPSLTGLPATTAPVGFTQQRLPVGIQIMGPWLEDATPIDVAARMADVVGGFQPPPGYAAP